MLDPEKTALGFPLTPQQRDHILPQLKNRFTPTELRLLAEPEGNFDPEQLVYKQTGHLQPEVDIDADGEHQIAVPINQNPDNVQPQGNQEISLPDIAPIPGPRSLRREASEWARRHDSPLTENRETGLTNGSAEQSVPVIESLLALTYPKGSAPHWNN